MRSKLFWMDAGERAVKTVAQTAVALLSASGISLLTLDWKGLVASVGLAGLLSLLTSIASSGSGNSASLVVDNVKNKTGEK